jgi:two-component system phosphate regulon sensor histidine kinase PhoR
MTKKIFFNTFLVGLAVLILCSALFFGLQYRQNIDEAFAGLEQDADYVAYGIALNGEEYLRSLNGKNRVTWIDPDGNVLYDSTVTGEIANQKELPEVIDAFENGTGQGSRRSTTTGVTTMYYAKLLSDGTVISLSRPVSAVRNALITVSPVFWVFVLVFILSGGLAFRVANQILRPVNALDLDSPDVSSTYSELAPLVARIQEQNLTIKDQMDELYRQKEFSALTDSMSEGFVLVDKDGRILSANSSSLRLMNDAEIGDDLFEYVDDVTSDAVRRALNGERSETVIPANGQSWQLIANPVLSHKQISGVVILMMDVTEREQRERLRQEFSANVSHELKTPLTSISGFAELMMQGIVSEDKVIEFAGDIYRESRRLIALVDDIIKLSKLDEDAAEPESEPVDLYELAEDTIDSLRSVAEKQNVTLNLTGGSATVTGVWQLLSEMVYNLCDNAIKYNKEGGSVTVDVSEAGDKVKLSVSDTGIGIPYSDQNRVFRAVLPCGQEPFKGDRRHRSGAVHR